MFKKFYPDYRFNSIDDIRAEFFTENGIKYACLDIDNTLVSYAVSTADERARRFLKMLEENGISYAFVSNNHKARVLKFASEFDAYFVANAAKPLRIGIKKAMRKMGANRVNTVFIGDQIFTDIYAGRRAGLLTVMVLPIEAKETPFFGIKRYFEKIVLKNYKNRT